MIRQLHIAWATVLVLAAPRAASAVQTIPIESDVVEAVWAVVGDSAILMTEVNAYLLRLQAQGVVVPQDPVGLRRLREQALDQLINEQLILQEAARDSTLAPSEADLEEAVQQEIDAQVSQFGTLGQLQAVLEQQNMTMAGFREQQKTLIRRTQLLQGYMAKQGRSASEVLISEDELRQFFDDNRDQMPTIQPSLSFEQLLFKPTPSDTAKATALAEANRVLDMLREGEDFAELATRFSQGPSAPQGGELGWVRRDGSFVKPFEDAVFGLPPGSISAPVETEFGYHLIRIERVRGGERRVRHILFIPTITADDLGANRARAEEAIATQKAGEALTDTVGVTIDTLQIQIAQLPQVSEAHAAALSTAQVAAVVGPIAFDRAGPNALAVARVLERRQGGAATFEDMREQIEARLQEQTIIERVVQRLRDAAYVDIRLPGGS